VEAWLGGLGCVPLSQPHGRSPRRLRSPARSFGNGCTPERNSPTAACITAALYDQLLTKNSAKIQAEIGTDRYTRGHFIKATRSSCGW